MIPWSGTYDPGDAEALTIRETMKWFKILNFDKYIFVGTVAGVYAGMDYGVKRIREQRDLKNAMIAGALTGALVSASCNNNRDKIVMDAITGGAVATAMEFHNYLT
nr:outer envelope pore protein 16, chloroplastic [Ipomoea batatas]